jgi:para-nitrobenzyl esterase
VTGPFVEVQPGGLRGAETDGVAAFKGIPYAASPAREDRWNAPRPVEQWVGVRDAADYGPSCPQPVERPPGWAHEEKEDEDCLVLNVWARTPLASLRPVMVFIHGGLFTLGSGSWPLYDGAALARRGDVVVVTVNHRLGALGYLYLADIVGNTDDIVSNPGMLDLVASLKWVRENIEVFGGDPRNVTIFGESGGGAKVSILHSMPSAKGLFHRAVIQSGPARKVQERNQASKTARALCDQLGIDPSPTGLKALKEVSAKEIVVAQQIVAPRPGPGLGFGPVLDGSVVESHPADAMSSGTAPDVPLLIGCNQDEATLLLMTDPVLTDPESLDEDGLRERLSGLGDHAETLLEGYRKTRPNASRLDLLIAIRSDAFARIGSIRLAEAKMRGGAAPVYMYLFRWGPGILRSGHGFELAFVFDNIRSAEKNADERQQLAERMSEAWIAFARGGDPNHSNLPKWPSYSLKERATMIFDGGECTLQNDPDGDERELWPEEWVRL